MYDMIARDIDIRHECKRPATCQWRGFRPTHQVNKHPWATTEASDGSRPPRSAAASSRLFWPAAAWRLWLQASLGWAGATPPPDTGSSDGDIAVELLSEVIMW